MIENVADNEYRCLTPKEIGDAVKIFRKMSGMKQIALAIEAGVDERTIQRIERGEAVSETSLRSVAKALGMRDDAFVGARHVLSSEQALHEAQKALDSNKVIEALDIATVKDCDSILRALAWVVDDQHVEAA